MQNTNYTFDYKLHVPQLLPLFKMLEAQQVLTEKKVSKIIKGHPDKEGKLFAKDQLIKAYRALAGTHGLKPFQQAVLDALTMKPTRTISGVTPVTILTKPFACPGKCIFCPNDVRMPKSYLSDEPGAQRAERNYFDPYLQTYNRLQALHNIGHGTNKVELIILGGTWSFYPEKYQIWFIKEAFRALNDFSNADGRQERLKRYQLAEETLAASGHYVPSPLPEQNQVALKKAEIDGSQLTESYNQVIAKTYTAPEIKTGIATWQTATWEDLFAEHAKNENGAHRCVGLVIETRPDNISEDEVIRIRKLGCTKTQIGVQSLQDEVLAKNNRGHDSAATRRAFSLLRQAGLKIHAHWMANLYGSTVELDKTDFDLLFSDDDFKPDELKVYPCSLIKSAELMQYYQAGKWKPYSEKELLEVVSHTLVATPAYCRLTRVIRDIPSPDIVVGNKKTNFRQIAQNHLQQRAATFRDIRAREIRNLTFDKDKVYYDAFSYQTRVSTEWFLQYLVPVDQEEKLLGFLRLSLPKEKPFIAELENAAIIREIHVYGQAVSVGNAGSQKPQHMGLGQKLLKKAANIATQSGFQQLAVISAVGTRAYYKKHGFQMGQLYQFLSL